MSQRGWWMCMWMCHLAAEARVPRPQKGRPDTVLMGHLRIQARQRSRLQTIARHLSTMRLARCCAASALASAAATAAAAATRAAVSTRAKRGDSTFCAAGQAAAAAAGSGGGVRMKVRAQCKIVRPARGESEADAVAQESLRLRPNEHGQRPRRGWRVNGRLENKRGHQRTG